MPLTFSPNLIQTKCSTWGQPMSEMHLSKLVYMRAARKALSDVDLHPSVRRKVYMIRSPF